MRVTRHVALVAVSALALPLAACGGDSSASPAVASVMPGEPRGEGEVSRPGLPHAVGASVPATPREIDGLGVTPSTDPVPPSPWLALELRMEEGERSRDSWSRTTLVRLERGVLRMRTTAELHHDGDGEPDLDASVVIDDATTAELAAAMRDGAFLRDVADVAEPRELAYVELAAVLERDSVRTRVVLENPTSDEGAAALTAMNRVVAIVRRATAPPALPP